MHVNAQGFGVLDEEFESSSLLQHVGRSLTIHSGPESSSPTIAAAACGLAHPHAELDTEGANPPSGGTLEEMVGSLSPAVVALIVISALIILAIGMVSCAYYHRLPIPLCGKYLYEREGHFVSVPPPPPPTAPPTAQQAALPADAVGVRVDKV